MLLSRSLFSPSHTSHVNSAVTMSEAHSSQCMCEHDNKRLRVLVLPRYQGNKMPELPSFPARSETAIFSAKSLLLQPPRPIAACLFNSLHVAKNTRRSIHRYLWTRCITSGGIVLFRGFIIRFFFFFFKRKPPPKKGKKNPARLTDRKSRIYPCL